MLRWLLWPCPHATRSVRFQVVSGQLKLARYATFAMTLPWNGVGKASAQRSFMYELEGVSFISSYPEEISFKAFQSESKTGVYYQHDMLHAFMIPRHTILSYWHIWKRVKQGMALLSCPHHGSNHHWNIGMKPLFSRGCIERPSLLLLSLLHIRQGFVEMRSWDNYPRCSMALE